MRSRWKETKSPKCCFVIFLHTKWPNWMPFSVIPSLLCYVLSFWLILCMSELLMLQPNSSTPSRWSTTTECAGKKNVTFVKILFSLSWKILFLSVRSNVQKTVSMVAISLDDYNVLTAFSLYCLLYIVCVKYDGKLNVAPWICRKLSSMCWKLWSLAYIYIYIRTIIYFGNVPKFVNYMSRRRHGNFSAVRDVFSQVHSLGYIVV